MVGLLPGRGEMHLCSPACSPYYELIDILSGYRLTFQFVWTHEYKIVVVGLRHYVTKQNLMNFQRNLFDRAAYQFNSRVAYINSVLQNINSL